MRRLNRLTAVVAVALLSPAPAVWAHGESGGAMACCPASQPADSPICHGGQSASMDCCTVRSAPVQAVSVQSAKLLAQPLALPADVAQTVSGTRSGAETVPAHSSRLHELGRYTLFSSFLL